MNVVSAPPFRASGRGWQHFPGKPAGERELELDKGGETREERGDR